MVTKKVTVVFVPVFNSDGHERFGRWNRPNQNGPEAMGWRVTAQNLNLNRDYVKADAPEMQAMLKLLDKWDPLIYVDLHVTDGADFQPDLAFLPSPLADFESPPRLRKVAGALQDTVVKKLGEAGFRALTFYPTFRHEDDPLSGFERGVSPPRFSQRYWGLRNRIGVLVETHSWKPYPRRVAMTEATIRDVVEFAAEKGPELEMAELSADLAGKELVGKKVALTYETTEKSRTLEFPGYAFKIEDSPISGKKRVIYDPKTNVIWKVPFYEELRVKDAASLPRGGYIVTSAYAPRIEEKLKLHGIQYHPLGPHELAVEVFRADGVEYAKETYEGRERIIPKGSWRPEKRQIPAGSVYIPSAQSLSRLVVQLFEPSAPDSFVQWGFFNSAFERKEYMENYVLEAYAADLLAKDSLVKEEFEKKVKADPDFAKSPEKRLDFFYRRHPSWDERYDLYPVFRTEEIL